MGRICKRVPLDFSWPLNELWIGYVNPYQGVKCPYCENGYTEKAVEIKNEVYPFRKGDYTSVPNPYREGYSYNPHAKEHNMTQDEVDYVLTQLHKNKLDDIERILEKHFPGTNKITPEVFSKLSLLMDITYNLDWYMIRYHSDKEGWEYGCSHCDGEGIMYLNEEIKRLHDEFEWQEPPTGEGYQMWETTSEGSPITPVFKTPEELAEYCERENVSLFGYQTGSKEEWLSIIKSEEPAIVKISANAFAI